MTRSEPAGFIWQETISDDGLDDLLEGAQGRAGMWKRAGGVALMARKPQTALPLPALHPAFAKAMARV